MNEIEAESVDVIIQALTERFGDKARDVAERQLIDASEESREKWRDIVTRLNRQEAARNYRDRDRPLSIAKDMYPSR